MEIVLKRLEIRNFKGIRNLSVPFEAYGTSISGENGTGKSSVFDAFVWLLFGKDSKNASVFNIKTVDAEGQPLHKLEHEVEGFLTCDGTPIKFSRTYKEKWVTRRASAEEVMDGHETLYAIDDVPVLAGEYQRRVSQILDEDIFRMITDPLFFNSKNWTDRRKVLIGMAGELNDAEILKSNPAFAPLIEKMGSKSIEEFKEFIKAQKKPIEESLKEIPARIDEVDRSTPEPENWTELEAQVEAIENKIDAIDASIVNRSKPIEAFYKADTARQSRIHAIDTEIQGIDHAAKMRLQSENNGLSAKRSQIKNKIEAAEKSIKEDSDLIEKSDRTMSEAEARRKGYFTQWNEVNQEEFSMPEGAYICPTCLRELEEGAIEEKENTLRQNHTKDKLRRLADIKTKGLQEKQTIEDAQKSKDEAEAHKAALEETLASLHEELSDIPEDSTEAILTPKESAQREQLVTERESLDTQKGTPPTIDVSDLTREKEPLQAELDELKTRLAKKAQIERQEKRKGELLDEQRDQAEAVAEWQKLEMLIRDFTKTKMSLVDERVNGRFKYVRFRMFDTQVNGEEVECCDPLIDGVPYTDANHAARVNAGIDIINALCEFYGVTAPIFIDNRESVNDLLPTPSQVISLIVTKDMKLTIQ